MDDAPSASESNDELWYNDEVTVVDGAPPEFRPGSPALIVGNNRTSGGLRYIIEFFDGSSVELPAELVRPTSGTLASDDS